MLRIVPDVAFHVFGKGPEAATFAALTVAAGYETLLYSPDEETFEAARLRGVPVRRMFRPDTPGNLHFDPFSAVTLFFHDHEWAPAIMARAAESQAFYIGAQGSRRARRQRDEALAGLGVSAEKIVAMKGPAGLFPGARDARTLAVSVLAEVVAAADELRRKSF